MTEYQYDVFISYSRRDGEEYADQLQLTLEGRGFAVWRDRRNISPYEDFSAEIETGITKSRMVAVCVTDDTKRTDSFVRNEIKYARALSKPIIPCRFNDTIPDILIIGYEILDFFDDYSREVERLCQLVADLIQSSPSEVIALGDPNSNTDLPHLIVTLFDENRNVDERINAALGLGFLGGDEAYFALSDLLYETTSKDLKYTAIDALSKLKDVRAFTDIFLGPRGDKDFIYQMEEILPKIVDRSAVPVLLLALRSQSNYLRVLAAKLLGNIGDRRATQTLIGLIQGKVDVFDDYFTRGLPEEAITALGNIGDDRAVKPLTEVLYNIYVESGRRKKNITVSIIKALEKIGTEEALEAVRDWERQQTS